MHFLHSIKHIINLLLCQLRHISFHSVSDHTILYFKFKSMVFHPSSNLSLNFLKTIFAYKLSLVMKSTLHNSKFWWKIFFFPVIHRKIFITFKACITSSSNNFHTFLWIRNFLFKILKFLHIFNFMVLNEWDVIKIQWIFLLRTK